MPDNKNKRSHECFREGEIQKRQKMHAYVSVHTRQVRSDVLTERGGKGGRERERERESETETDR